MNILTEYLRGLYKELEPIEFYRHIFKEGELQKKDIYEKGKYNGIVVEVTKEKRFKGEEKF